MSRRPPEDERDVLLAIADVVADGSDLTDEEIFGDLEEMGMDAKRVAENGAKRVADLLNRQRLSWQTQSRTRSARVAAELPPRRGSPRDRRVLLALARERQQSGTRVEWHKLEDLNEDQLEDLLAEDDLARALDRLASETEPGE